MSYHKLVRDKIVDIIKSNGEKPIYRVLNNDEYLTELHKKLFEEAKEFIEEDSIDELADLLEVIYAIAKEKNIQLSKVEQIRLMKREKRGGFDNKIYLETVEQELNK